MVKDYLKLVRWTNLAIIVLIAVAIRYFIIDVIITTSFPEMMMSLQLSTFDFLILVLSCVFIAAAGYVINDIYDVETDKINKGGISLIPEVISKENSLNFHHSLNAVGLVLGLYICYVIDNFSFSMVFIIPIALLRLYSIRLSRSFLLGNFVISILASLLIITLGLFDLLTFHNKYFKILYYNHEVTLPNSPSAAIFYWIMGLAMFSFLITLIREIIKDCEDIKGDESVGAKTLAIVLGIKKTKVVIISLAFITIMILHYLTVEIMANQHFFPFSFEYGSLVTALLIGLSYLTYKAQDKDGFHLLSNISKGIMLVGLGYTLVHYLA